MLAPAVGVSWFCFSGPSSRLSSGFKNSNATNRHGKHGAAGAATVEGHLAPIPPG